MYYRYLLAAVLGTAALWACSGDQPDSLTTGGSASSNSSSDASSSNSGGPATSGAVTVASSSSGMGFNCDPPADPSSLYAIFEQPLDSAEPMSMCEYRNDVVLIVNTAAK